MPRTACAKLPKERYSETYTRPGLAILPEYLPTTPHASAHTPMVPCAAYILRAGSVEPLEGNPARAFQDIRIYFKERT